MKLKAIAVSAVAATVIGTSELAAPAAMATTDPGATLAPAHHQYPRHPRKPKVRYVRVRRGNTLTQLAHRMYGKGSRWVALWWDNRRRIHNPNVLHQGTTLRVLPWHKLTRRERARALALASRTVARPSTAPATSPVSPAAPVVSDSSFQNCVIARESGGNPDVMNSSGHWGLYQFSASTWAAYGGNPATFGSASVAEQNQVFANAMAAGGQSNWSAYDGC
jgi:Transglycosylase-like domain